MAATAVARSTRLDLLLDSHRAERKRRKALETLPESIRFEEFVRQSGCEPAFRSAYASDCGFKHFMFYYDQVYRGSPARIDPIAVEAHKADFLRAFFDCGQEFGTFARVRERMERDRFEERPLMSYHARFGIDRRTDFRCAWRAEELLYLSSWILYNCRHPHAELVWLRFESGVEFGEAARVTVALAVATGVMTSPADIGELRRSPLLVWVLLSIVARSDPSFREEWTAFFRVMKDELNHDDMAYDFVKLLTLNAYAPFMSEAMSDYLSDNGFVQIEYRDQQQQQKKRPRDGRPAGGLRRGRIAAS